MAAPPSRQPSRAAGSPRRPVDPTRPTVMQKAIAPEPARLLPGARLRPGVRVRAPGRRGGPPDHARRSCYDALGLGYPDSPFTPDAEEVYVLRWPAYRPSLYRIPYGGQHEAAMRAMEGWVIERPPFRGNGFAPGESSDVIAEFKVDSARLPHGAQLWRIGADGTERVVAAPGHRRGRPGDGSGSCDARRLRGPLAGRGVRGQPGRRRRAALPARARRGLRGGTPRPVRPGACRRPRSRTWRTCGPPAPGRGSRSSCSASTTAGCGSSTPAVAGRWPQAMGLEEFDFGVYQGWAPAAEVTDLREQPGLTAASQDLRPAQDLAEHQVRASRCGKWPTPSSSRHSYGATTYRPEPCAVRGSDGGVQRAVQLQGRA